MIQKEILTAPKVNESIPYGVGYKPFTVGALSLNIMYKKHGFTIGKPRRLYRIWSNIRQRCNNPNNTRYEYYGGKGIKRCKEWDDFTTFCTWAITNGYNDNLTIDRINGNGNYEPSNCRWVTQKVNNQNKTHSEDYGIYPKKGGHYVQLTIDGKYYCGGYSTNISEVKKYKSDLLKKIQIEGMIPQDIERKIRSRDIKTGRIIWI